MPTPKNISTLKSFLASVQFYSKFLPPYFSEITEPLYKLTRKGQQWKWGKEEATSFKKIKRLLCTGTVLAHYDPSLPLGLSCDASECGVGAVLFHRFADGSEHPIFVATFACCIFARIHRFIKLKFTKILSQK